MSMASASFSVVRVNGNEKVDFQSSVSSIPKTLPQKVEFVDLSWIYMNQVDFCSTNQIMELDDDGIIWSITTYVGQIEQLDEEITFGLTFKSADEESADSALPANNPLITLEIVKNKAGQAPLIFIDRSVGVISGEEAAERWLRISQTIDTFDIYTLGQITEMDQTLDSPFASYSVLYNNPLDHGYVTLNSFIFHQPNMEREQEIKLLRNLQVGLPHIVCMRVVFLFSCD